MKTSIYRIDLTEEDPKEHIQEACDKQLDLGNRLVSTFIWNMSLYLIFQPK